MSVPVRVSGVRVGVGGRCACASANIVANVITVAVAVAAAATVASMLCHGARQDTTTGHHLDTHTGTGTAQAQAQEQPQTRTRTTILQNLGIFKIKKKPNELGPSTPQKVQHAAATTQTRGELIL